MNKLKSGCLSELVLEQIAQIGLITRRELANCMYRTCEDGGVERYTQYTKPMTQAVNQLKKCALIEEVKCHKKIYLALTKEGWDYINKYKLRKSAYAEGVSLKNKKSRDALLDNAEIIGMARSMYYLSLPSEKPDMGTLINRLSKEYIFGNASHAGDYYNDMSTEDMLERLEVGICYTNREIRDAYASCTIDNIASIRSRRKGMIFTKDKIIALYDMESKSTVISGKAERDFDSYVIRDVKEVYLSNSLPVPKLTAYILLPTMSMLPSFFTGYVDGEQSGNRKSNQNALQDSYKSKFRLAAFTQYSEVYAIPSSTNDAEYRCRFKQYNERESDTKRFLKANPDMNTQHLLVSRFPDLVEMKSMQFKGNDITIVGPGDPRTVDLISRCLRRALANYYDIDTFAKLEFRHYNDKGQPLLGNTDQVDQNREKLKTLV